MRKYKVLTLLLGLAIVACKPGEFGNINIDPNNPSVPNTASLLTSALRSVGNMTTEINTAKYVQQFGDVTYIDESRYKSINWNYNSFYTGPLNSYQTIISLNTMPETKSTTLINGSNNNQIAVARIMRAYTFLWITDRVGNIAYSEALKGSANFTPTFDKQQDIYTNLFKELKEASQQFDGGKEVVGDILLGGKVDKWKKFAHSIRMIMAMRISKADPVKGKAEFLSAMTDGILASNTDNVKYTYLLDANNEHPLYTNYVTTKRKDHAVASTFVDYLKNSNDPRLPVMADKNLVGEYRGVPYGISPVTWTAQDVSLVAASITQQNSPVNVLTYAELLFCMAEAAHIGWISGSAEDYYKKGIEASLQQWLGSRFSTTTYETYIAQPEVAYSAQKAFERIGTQKWITLFYQGSEAWAEWRRMNFPVLTPAKPFNSGSSGQIPVRLGYPTTEATLNKTNYDAVVSSQGADTPDTKVWWDKD